MTIILSYRYLLSIHLYASFVFWQMPNKRAELSSRRLTFGFSLARTHVYAHTYAFTLTHTEPCALPINVHNHCLFLTLLFDTLVVVSLSLDCTLFLLIHTLWRHTHTLQPSRTGSHFKFIGNVKLLGAQWSYIFDVWVRDDLGSNLTPSQYANWWCIKAEIFSTQIVFHCSPLNMDQLLPFDKSDLDLLCEIIGDGNLNPGNSNIKDEDELPEAPKNPSPTPELTQVQNRHI